MNWYKFTIPQNEQQPDNEQKFVSLLRTLSDKNAKNILLIYKMSNDNKSVHYFLTTPSEFNANVLSDLFSLEPCSQPESNEKVKFVTGDGSLFNSIFKKKGLK